MGRPPTNAALKDVSHAMKSHLLLNLVDSVPGLRKQLLKPVRQDVDPSLAVSQAELATVQIVVKD